MPTVSEVALRGEAHGHGAFQALGTMRDVAGRMGRSVSTLLKLARLEMGVESFSTHGVDLGATLAALLRSMSTADRERSGLGLALSCALAEHAGMQLDFELEEGLFRAILSGRQAQGAELFEPAALNGNPAAQ